MSEVTVLVSVSRECVVLSTIYVCSTGVEWIFMYVTKLRCSDMLMTSCGVSSLVVFRRGTGPG